MKAILKVTLILLCGLLSPLSLMSQEKIVVKPLGMQRVAEGAKIPELHFEKIIQGPKEINRASLGNKIVILEFWATWCAPCIKLFPKLNELVNHYQDKEVVFLSITDETTETVRPFLDRKPLNTWVASDLDRSVIDTFGVHSLPTTVVINSEGLLFEYLDSKELTQNYMDRLLADPSSLKEKSTTVSVNEKISIKAGRATEETESTSYSVMIQEDQESSGESGMLAKALGIINKKGWTVRGIFANTYGVSEGLVKGPDEVLNKKFVVKVKLPRGKSAMIDELIIEALFQELGISAKRLRSKEKLMELSAPAGLSKNLSPSKSLKGRFSADDGVIIGRNFGLKGLVRNVESTLGISIYDNTKLSGKYDYDLFWDHTEPTTVIKSLNEQLGLELQEKIIEVETVEVDYINR